MKVKHYIKTRKLLFFLIIIFLLPTNSFAQRSIPSLVKKIQPAIVLITVYDAQGKESGQGSGFFVSQEGEVITNLHVVSDASSAIVKTATGAMFKVTGIVAKDEKRDLAKIIIDTKDDSFPYLNLSPTVPKVGERIFVIGSPFGLESTVSDGLVSAIRTFPEIGNIIQISAPISPGSSGSPVLNLNGQVVGVASFQFIKGQNLNFAIPSANIVILPSIGQSSVIPLRKEHLSSINPDVQLQDNGWIRIVNQFVKEQTPEEYFRKEKDDPILKSFKGKIFKQLHVKIQFLKPCKATTKDEEWRKRNPNVSLSNLAAEEAQISLAKGLIVLLQQEGKKKEAEELLAATEKKYSNFWADYVFLKFRCDYRTKVFAIFFSSKGYEIETMSEIPIALLVDEFSQERKTEMLPGEATYVTFLIPDDATSWEVWVPK